MNDNHYEMSKPGCIFVLTQTGYDATPDHIKHERKIGKPVSNIFRTHVPSSWVKKGYVAEAECDEE